MIRRLVALSVVLTAGLLAVGATSGAGDPPAQEAGDYFACAYTHTPVDFGVCFSRPI